VSTGGASLRAIPGGERRWLAVVSAVLLLLTLVPLGVAVARTPGGQVFSGFVYEARDGNSYVAKTMEGVQGRWLYHDPYTSEQQPETLIHLPYLLLGQLDRLLHAPVPLLLQLVRLGLAAALLVAIYILCAECFADAGRRRLAFLLAVLGGGLGFLGIAHAGLLGYHYVTLDIGVSGSSGLDSLNLAPHIVLVCLSSAWAAILWLRQARDPHPARLAGGLAWILVVSSIYPQVAATWAVVGVLAWVLRPAPARLAMAAAWVVAALPYVAYGLYLRGSNPVFANWPPAADVDVGDPLSFLLWAHFLMLPFALGAVVMLLRRRSQPEPGDDGLELMAVWLGVIAVLMYAPGLPPVMHRLFYASYLPFGILAAAGLWTWAMHAGRPARRRRLLVYPTALMCLVGLETAAEGLTIPLQHRDDLALYFPADEAQVLEQLRSREPGGGRVVMNSYLSGLFVPGISGQTTYLGFPFETLDLQRKNAESRAFYSSGSAATLRSRAAELGIDYVLWGTYERGLGGTDPGVIAGWSLVASSGQARLYRVETAATALR
jgi:hypothetical protein